jgi:hypothetical protein
MEKRSDILNRLTKAKRPTVPASFFETFSDEVWQLILLEDETDGFLNNLKIKRFKNDLNNPQKTELKHISGGGSEMPERQKKSTTLRHLALWLGAAAASVALIFAVSFFNESQSQVADTLSTEEVLLAYLDEEDLVDYIVENSAASETDSVALLNEYLYEEMEDGLFEYYENL